MSGNRPVQVLLAWVAKYRPSSIRNNIYVISPTVYVMAEEPNSEQLQLRMAVPEQLVVGTFANLLGVWHTQNDFTLDFAVVGQPDFGEDGQPLGTITAPVVARIKIPTSVIFNIAKAIADNVTTYEATFGTITQQPDDTPMFPPRGDDV